MEKIKGASRSTTAPRSCSEYYAWAPPSPRSSNLAWQAANYFTVSSLQSEPYRLINAEQAVNSPYLPQELKDSVGKYQAAAYTLLNWLIGSAGFSSSRDSRGRIGKLFARGFSVTVSYVQCSDYPGLRSTIPRIASRSWELLASNVTCQVPKHVLEALETDIFDRIKVHEWYKALPAHDDRFNKNNNHAHHIDVLFKVLEKLSSNGVLPSK